MTRPVLFALAAALAAFSLPARAQFEGRLDYQMKDPHGTGTITVYASPAGARTEFSRTAATSAGGMAGDIRFTALWRRADPDHVYMVNDARKAYTVIDTNKANQQEMPKIEKVGTSQVAGYPCQRVRLTGKNGQSHEICVTDKLGSFAVPLGANAQWVALWAELRRQGLDGVPVSWTDLSPKEEDRASIVLVSARRQSLPASQFMVPSGYTRGSAMEALASPEQQQKMQEMMDKMRDKMTPEQRQQLEQLMKQ